MSDQFAMHLAIQLLSQRDFSELELRQKLLRKALPVQIVDQTLRYLMERRYLSDELLCQKLIEKYCVMRDLGPAGIINKLRKRGISNQIIMTQMSQIDFSEEETWAKNLLEKHNLLDDPQKAARFLYSRGFSHSIISRIVTLLLAECGE